MNSKCVTNGKNKRLIIASIIFTMAIIMCGNGIISNTNISKKTTKKVVIQKEIVDGVEIKILADKGVFPQDAKATIKKIDKESDTSKVKSAIENSTTSSKQKIKSVYSYDITIKDSKGNELQPDTSKGEVLVAFKDIKGIDENNRESVQVWHVKDDLDKAEKVKDGVEVCKNNVDVKVQHFSIYSVVINEEQDKTIKYFEGANGDTSYFMIEDEKDLYLFRDIVNGDISDTAQIQVEYENNTKENVSDIGKFAKNARLEDNIVMPELENWEPIGKYSNNNLDIYNEGFQGNFDGNGKTITFNVNNNCRGLFGLVGKWGCISNLTVTGKLQGTDLTGNIGGIVELNYGIVQNCILSDFTINFSKYTGNLGGVVGENGAEGKILNVEVFNQSTIIGNAYFDFNNMDGAIGGIVGKNNGSVEACFMKASSISFNCTCYVRIGGIIGQLSNGRVNKIYCKNMNIIRIIPNNGSLQGSHIGGLVGCCENGTTITNGYYQGEFLKNIGLIRDGTQIGKLIGSIAPYLDTTATAIATDLYYIGNANENESGLIGTNNAKESKLHAESNIVSLVEALNNSLKSNIWYTDESNGGYPIFTRPEPYYVKTDNTISVYGNGYPIIVDKNESGNTVIYFDKDGDNEIGSEDSLVKTLDENGLDIINIYGGGHNRYINHNSKIIVKGGEINSIYGGGKSDANDRSAKVLLGTVIDIKGGKIGYIDANGKADNGVNSDNVVTSEDKTINISGAPVIGTDTMDGINLDSFTNKNITNTLTGSPDSIYVKKDNPQHEYVIATADKATFIDKYNVFKVKDLPDKRTIFKKEKNIIIVETFDASLNPLDGPESNSNVLGILGFDDNDAKKGFPWKGKIRAKLSYVLPDTISVKMGDTLLTVGTDYTWDKKIGEISIAEVTDDIQVTAKAIYVPPIIAVDKPFVSTTDFSYTGIPQSPILIDTDKYTVSVTRETNVGEYTMVVSLKDKVYTRWTDGTNDDLYIKWRINKVDLKVIAKDKSITYGDSPTNAGVSYEGFVNGEDESVLKGTLSYDYDYNLYDNVGNYTITPKGYEADNYNITYTLGTLKVLPKKLSFKWPSPSEFKYDGKAKVMTASIVGIVNNDDVRIASYEHNKADKVGTYVAKVTGITGTKKDNYTLEGATNISKKWSIVKTEDKEDKDKNENKDNIKDNGDKNDTSGSNNNKGNVNNNKNNNNNSSNNTSSNKGNSNNNQSNGNYAKVSMYDKLANNNDYKTDIEGAIEGVKTSDNEIQVELTNGMVISAMGDFEESIRLMVKEIKSKRKEWDWVNSLTKDIGTNKGLYDIFFVNSKGVKVNTGKGTKISILSREKLQKADVYYIRTSSERLKLKSWKEEYTVKFRMIENGYYTLILNDKNNIIDGKGQDVSVVDKESIIEKDDKDTDIIIDKDNQDGTEEDKTNVNASKDGASGSEINTSQDSTNHNIQNIGKQQKEKEDGINWVIIISIIFSIIVMIIVSVFILKRFSKDK